MKTQTIDNTTQTINGPLGVEVVRFAYNATLTIFEVSNREVVKHSQIIPFQTLATAEALTVEIAKIGYKFNG